jgi:hypothetical protein
VRCGKVSTLGTGDYGISAREWIRLDVVRPDHVALHVGFVGPCSGINSDPVKLMIFHRKT